jgi:hypothetical protein
MATLFGYMQLVQRLIRDTKQEQTNPDDLIAYINQGRREVAERAQCIRRLTPISASVVSATVVDPGTGYTAPVVSITAPDFPSGLAPYPNGAQATSNAILLGGTIAAVDIVFGGSGYFQPQAGIIDPTGTGASISLTLSPMNLLQPNQEVYQFSDLPVQSWWPGIDYVYALRSNPVIIYSNYRYALPTYAFSEYLARVAQFPFQYLFVPTFAAQFGQGSDGSIYAYPLASQQFQWQWDCLCAPSDLLDDQSYDAVPHPWAQSVAYYAAHLCYLNYQNLNAAEYYMKLYENSVVRRSQAARPSRVVNPYGRY